MISITRAELRVLVLSGVGMWGAALASCVDERKPGVEEPTPFGTGALGGPGDTEQGTSRVVATPGASGASSTATGAGQPGNGSAPVSPGAGTAQGSGGSTAQSSDMQGAGGQGLGGQGLGGQGLGGQGGAGQGSASAPSGSAGSSSVAPAPPEGPELPPNNLATRLWFVGTEGTEPGQFGDVRHLGVDAAGNIYVAELAESGPPRVQRFDSQGRFLNQWFTFDESNIVDMAGDRNGQLYVLQSRVISRYEGATGNALGVVAIPATSGAIEAIAPTPDNGLLAVSSTQILRFDAAGQLTLTVEDTIEQTLEDSFFVDGASMDAAGNIYVTATFESAVYKFNAAGVFQTRIGSEGQGVGLFQSSPRAALADRRGRVYAADFDGIEVFEPSGAPRGIIPASGGVFAMEVTAQDELIVLDRNAYTLTKYQLTP